jgi:tRNA pseudouridine55 synthase
VKQDDRRAAQENPDGVLVIDKAAGMTSHDVVDRLRRITKVRQIGHTGTLDPFATGVLVLCVGRATKVARFINSLDKEYEGEMIFGAVSSTYDIEGEKRHVAAGCSLDQERIEKELASFRGEILQTPPPYSAVKVNGKKLYQYAREGKEAKPQPRRVTVYEFSILSLAPPNPPVWRTAMRFRTRVSSGTYVRSLCHDLGLALGCGAYVSALRRTRVGHFRLADAISLEELESHPAMVRERLITIRSALRHLPAVRVKPASLPKILTGRALSAEDVIDIRDNLFEQRPVMVCDSQDNVLAIYQATGETQEQVRVGEQRGLMLRPIRILATS